MTTLFYEAWQKYKFYIEYERNGTSNFDRYLLNLVGFGPEALKQKFDKGESPLRRELFSYFSGMFAQKPRNALNLEVMLSFYFSLPFKIQQFAGRWLKLDSSQCTQLGRKNAVLGQSAVAGNRVWDYQSCVRIELGPLELADYQRFQPGTEDYQKLVELVRFTSAPNWTSRLRRSSSAKLYPWPAWAAKAMYRWAGLAGSNAPVSTWSPPVALFSIFL